MKSLVMRATTELGPGTAGLSREGTTPLAFRAWGAAGLVALIAALGTLMTITRPGVSPARQAAEDAYAPIATHLRAGHRARDDAQRCAGELRVLAARHPGLVAVALDVDVSQIARAHGTSATSAVALASIETSVAVVDAAVADLVRLTGEEAATLPRAAAWNLARAGDLSARAHRAADRLCEARESVSAAMLTPPVRTRSELANGGFVRSSR